MEGLCPCLIFSTTFWPICSASASLLNRLKEEIAGIQSWWMYIFLSTSTSYPQPSAIFIACKSTGSKSFTACWFFLEYKIPDPATSIRAETSQITVFFLIIGIIRIIWKKLPEIIKPVSTVSSCAQETPVFYSKAYSTCSFKAFPICFFGPDICSEIIFPNSL